MVGWSVTWKVTFRRSSYLPHPFLLHFQNMSCEKSDKCAMINSNWWISLNSSIMPKITYQGSLTILVLSKKISGKKHWNSKAIFLSNHHYPLYWEQITPSLGKFSCTNQNDNRPIRNSASENCRALAFEANKVSFIFSTWLLQSLKFSQREIMLKTSLLLKFPTSKLWSPYFTELSSQELHPQAQLMSLLSI